MKKYFLAGTFLPLFLSVLFLVPPARAGEALKLYEWQRIEGEVIDIRPVFIEGKGDVFLVIIKSQKGEEEFLQFKMPVFEKGQRVIFKNNTIEILK